MKTIVLEIREQYDSINVLEMEIPSALDKCRPEEEIISSKIVTLVKYNN